MDSINMITKSNLGSDQASQNHLQIQNDGNTDQTNSEISFQKGNIIHSDLQSRDGDQESVLGSIRSIRNKNQDHSMLGENISLSDV